MGFLIDTCIWIDVERGTISPADVAVYTTNEPVFISPVTIAELTFGAEMAKEEQIRQKRLVALNRLRKKPFIIIDESTGDRWMVAKKSEDSWNLDEYGDRSYMWDYR